jgi:hypothetical protein
MPRASWRGFLRLSLVSCPIYLPPRPSARNPSSCIKSGKQLRLTKRTCRIGPEHKTSRQISAERYSG